MTSTEEFRERVLEQLGNVVCPCAAAEGYSSYGIDDMGLVRAIERDGDEVLIDLRLTSPGCLKIGYLEDEIAKHVGSLPSIESVSVTADEGLEWRPDMMSEEFQEARRDRIRGTVADLES
jgi:metal-sulfur cluster biosynthetic enzyme